MAAGLHPRTGPSVSGRHEPNLLFDKRPASSRYRRGIPIKWSGAGEIFDGWGDFRARRGKIPDPPLKPCTFVHFRKHHSLNALRDKGIGKEGAQAVTEKCVLKRAKEGKTSQKLVKRTRFSACLCTLPGRVPRSLPRRGWQGAISPAGFHTLRRRPRSSRSGW